MDKSSFYLDHSGSSARIVLEQNKFSLLNIAMVPFRKHY